MSRWLSFVCLTHWSWENYAQLNLGISVNTSSAPAIDPSGSSELKNQMEVYTKRLLLSCALGGLAALLGGGSAVYADSQDFLRQDRYGQFPGSNRTRSPTYRNVFYSDNWHIPPSSPGPTFPKPPAEPFCLSAAADLTIVPCQVFTPLPLDPIPKPLLPHVIIPGGDNWHVPPAPAKT
jgi:hypothetical protein